MQCVPVASVPGRIVREDARTPLDQPNAERDLELTRQIRQQIMDAGLSTDAENVK